MSEPRRDIPIVHQHPMSPDDVKALALGIAMRLNLCLSSSESPRAFLLNYLIANQEDIAEQWNEDHDWPEVKDDNKRKD